MDGGPAILFPGTIARGQPYNTHLDGGQGLAGFGAALPEDATGRAALALVAEAHATLLWLLGDDQMWPWAWAG